MPTRKEVMADGSRFYCLECHATFKDVPTYQREMGGYTLSVPSCPKCSCDLIGRFSDDQPVEAGVDYDQ